MTNEFRPTVKSDVFAMPKDRDIRGAKVVFLDRVFNQKLTATVIQEKMYGVIIRTDERRTEGHSRTFFAYWHQIKEDAGVTPLRCHDDAGRLE